MERPLFLIKVVVLLSYSYSNSTCVPLHQSSSLNWGGHWVFRIVTRLTVSGDNWS